MRHKGIKKVIFMLLLIHEFDEIQIQQHSTHSTFMLIALFCLVPHAFYMICTCMGHCIYKIHFVIHCPVVVAQIS